MLNDNERRTATSRRVITQPLKWHSPGGKHYLAKRIIELMPPHTHYVEPYFGGGSVLLQKAPEGVSEVVNDINSGLTTFWRVLQSDRLFNDFQRIVEAMPFSAEEFANGQTSFRNGRIRSDGTGYACDTSDLIWQAVWFFVLARQSRQGLMKDFATLSRNRTRRGMNEQVSSWLTAIEGLPDVHTRLKRVVILNRDALDVIRQQDGPKTLFYCDPTYLHETRVTTSDYQHEMTEQDHADLLVTLGGLSVWEHLPMSVRQEWHLSQKPIVGKFMLSGYRSQMYDDVAEGLGWHRVDIEIDNKASSKKTKDRKTESIWMNYTT